MPFDSSSIMAKAAVRPFSISTYIFLPAAIWPKVSSPRPELRPVDTRSTRHSMKTAISAKHSSLF